MDNELDFHRLQFAFTITFHYLFPQLTMGLALLILALKIGAARTGLAHWNEAARFWIRIFGINFAVGVVTGIPMEFQFATNWARLTDYSGGVIGQTLAMEGMFAFFLESSFLALVIWGERRFGPRMHLAATAALFAGSWLSGYFIVATNAFLQHPVGYVVDAAGKLQIGDFFAFLFNPWALVQYAHTMLAALVTGAFVMCAVGAYWMLRQQHLEVARLQMRVGLAAGLVASILVAFPSGDLQGKLVAKHQPISLAAMEGRFESGAAAELVLIGQPNVEARRIDNPVAIPGALSFIAYGSFSSHVRGLNEFPADQWPTNIELLYYCFHIMAGLGTVFIALMALANLQLWRGRLESSRGLLWCLMLAFPFPYIANTVGWLTSELGRQPWLIHGLMRTSEGSSINVHAGNTLFTLLGFAGIYLVLGVLFLFLVARELNHGPLPHGAPKAAGGEHG